MKSALFSATGLFCYSEFTLASGRSHYFVDNAQVKKVFHGISATIEGMALASYMAEIAMELAPAPPEADAQLRLLLNCLYMISEHKADLRAIKAVFELRTMSECGFLPQLVCCRDCGTYDAGDAFYLDVQEGYLLCADCAAKAGKRCNLDRNALFALRHICLVEDKKIFSFKISVGSLEKLAAVAEQYALTHLDKPLKSYDFLKTVLP
jgi:DNA repair protein RecO (recombination protein O)